MKRKENHIWPAYVDMMTVLLLVYVLVSLLFAMMIKQDTEAKYEEKLNGLMAMKITSATELDGATLHQSASKQTTDLIPEEIIKDDNHDMLDRYKGDLVIILQPGEEKISAKDQVKITDWYLKNQSEIKVRGIYFGVVTRNNNSVSIGAVYRKQYMLYMDTLRFLVNTQIDFKPGNYIHRSPMPVDGLSEEYMVMRVAK